MNSVRYIGMDVRRDTISVAVLEESGRLMMQSVLATRAGAILDFIHGVRGTLHVTFEEGTHSAWLYDVLVRRVEKLVVCNPRECPYRKTTLPRPSQEMVRGTSGCTDLPSGLAAILQAFESVSPAAILVSKLSRKNDVFEPRRVNVSTALIFRPLVLNPVS